MPCPSNSIHATSTDAGTSTAKDVILDAVLNEGLALEVARHGIKRLKLEVEKVEQLHTVQMQAVN